jgi:lipopolysaccharide/colanic/teichoic acid biosynthesis glycosyltransferase
MLKRAFDLFLTATGLALLTPLLAVLAIVVRCTSPGPVFFRQERLGRNGRAFMLLKFRTMQAAQGAEKACFDAGDISRVTPLGRILRRWKLDELPQLWNVLTGDMSLVGPRPEVRTWVDAYPERWSRVLTVRPGITDPASIVYRNEEEILAQSPDPQRTYREEILPHKLSLYEDYVKTQSFRGDVGILLKTLWIVVRGEGGDR